MNAEHDFSIVGISEPKAAYPVMPRIARLALAIFIALVALVSLCGKLAETKRKAQDGLAAVTAGPADGSTLLGASQNVPAACQRPVLSVTKQIDPDNPDTGDVVTITFVITGLGLKQVDVALIQDISGSMSEHDMPGGRTRLAVAQAAAITFVNELEDMDWVAVVAYSTTARTVQSLTTDTDAAILAINGLTAGGWTNIGEGLHSGYEQLVTPTQHHSSTVKAMVLLSDGSANCVTPNSCPEPVGLAAQYALNRAKMAGDCSILIYTIGFGDLSEDDPDLLVNQELLQTIAYTTGGEYYYSPEGANLGTIYQEIALALRNLVITDVLPPGVDVDCSLFPPGTCSQENGLTTTIVLSPANETLVTNPLILSFTATVNLDPGYEGPINVDGSGICYDGPGGPTCEGFENPTTTIGGRKITGVVFEDLDCDSHFGRCDNVLSGVVVTTSNGLTSVTDISDVYVFRTSAEPTLTVAISIPTNYVTTTSEILHIAPLSGTYDNCNFGLYPAIDGISLHLLQVEPLPEYHGQSTALYYSVVNQDQEDEVVSGTVVVMDSLSRLLDEKHFDLGPGETIPLSSPSFTVPRDIVITLTATATYGISGGLTVSDQVTRLLCPEDVYEPDDSRGEAYPILPDELQIHDFFRPGDEDWVGVRLYLGDRSLYVFTAHPLGATGVPISLTLYRGGTPLVGSNQGDPRASVQVGQVLMCTADVCDYFLQAQSPTSGCWTDYELSVKKTREDELWYVWLPIVLRSY